MGCGTRSLSRRVPCALLKVGLAAKDRPEEKKHKFVFSYIFIFILFIEFYFYFSLKHDQYFPFWATSVHFLLLLVRSQAASDLCKAE